MEELVDKAQLNVLLEWSGDATNDLIAECIVSVLSAMATSPATVKCNLAMAYIYIFMCACER